MYSAILFLPLIGALIAGLGGRIIGHRGAEIVTTALLLVAALLSAIALIDVGFGGYTGKVYILRWIDSGALEVDWSIRIDTLTAVMLVVVTWVSSLVHVYSIGYMSHDPHRARFFAYLSLFTFAMLMLITADNFVQLFFGWEGVGLASYLLIGFWYKKPSANAAAMKAFVVNRVGDFGLILGLAGIFLVFGSLEFDTVFAMVPEIAGQTFTFAGMQLDVMTTICLLLFMGAMGKSAQFLLHTWLPDAMEGPTPVSALIHAATMVTAGVFLVARTSPMFEFAPDALWVVTLVGATTAFFAATVGLVQNDIKRVIAYSTCSQLGYMFVALGLGGYQMAIFHLFTHAFFKALLFLGAGSVIHAVSNEQDMRKMGGLYKMIPGTWFMMIIGTLGLTGFPYLAGYYSKDAIIEAAYMADSGLAGYAFAMTVVAALMTSFYSWRLIFMTFHGESRASNEVISHVHESPWVMLVPLIVLSAGTVLAGFPFKEFFVGHDQATFWNGAIFTGPANDLINTFHDAPAWVVWSPFVMMVIGFATAWLFYIARPDIPKTLAREQQPLYQFLLNKWYFDELYNLIFVRPAMWLGRVLWKGGDGYIIDGFGPNGIAARVLDITRNVVKLQTGFVYHYAFAMLIGVAAFITYYTLTGAN
ncbi:NADH-quinone oxidoreductase subunit L [Pyruvatibacter sp.]|uniref:NADH-quinone oxidoreductase subunit L n=1 Tax=Pyruvatibacter sp. TaxID=1981328 RepID=UPI0032EA91CC